MDTLRDTLIRLKEWLAQSSDFPGWRDERMIEIGRGTRYEPASNGAHAWHVAESALSTPEAYAPRFEELLGAGYSWINVSCYGIIDGTAMIAVELPRSATGVPRGRTSVNLSGPPLDGGKGAPRWDGASYVVITRE